MSYYVPVGGECLTIWWTGLTTLLSNIFKKPPTPVCGTRINATYQTDIIQGYSGYLIQPRFFNINELKNYDEKPAAARFVDDVWVSAHAHVDKFIIPLSRLSFVPFYLSDFYKKSSLAKINNGNRTKDEDRNNSIMIKYFYEKWMNYEK